MPSIRFKDLILFENDDYIIINKPPYLSTLEDRNDPVNVLRLSKSYFPDAQVCHRLDKGTSGVLALAKNADAYRLLAVQFEDRKVSKTYHAVVEGLREFNNVRIDKPILVLGKGTVRIDSKGKEATTLINTKDIFKDHTLLECKPHSGRTHQIRIHLAHLDSPIVGDTTYGGHPFYLSNIKRNYNLKKDHDEQPLIRRMALHAAGLCFKLKDQKEQEFMAPYPKDFAVLVRQLDKNR